MTYDKAVTSAYADMLSSFSFNMYLLNKYVYFM